MLPMLRERIKNNQVNNLMHRDLFLVITGMIGIDANTCIHNVGRF